MLLDNLLLFYQLFQLLPNSLLLSLYRRNRIHYICLLFQSVNIFISIFMGLWGVLLEQRNLGLSNLLNKLFRNLLHILFLFFFIVFFLFSVVIMVLFVLILFLFLFMFLLLFLSTLWFKMCLLRSMYF